MSPMEGVRRRINQAAPAAARSWRRARRRARALRGDRAFARHDLVGPGDFWQEKRAWQIAFLKDRCGLLPAHRFLDIGCGTLRGGIPIIEYLEPEHYTGLEVRPHVLDEAREELELYPAAAAKRPNLVLSTGFPGLPDLGQFDKAWGFSVLIHMADPIARECLEYVARALSPGGVFHANVHIGPPANAEGGAGFPVVTRPESFYQGLAEAAGLRVEDLGTLASLGHSFGLRGDSHHMLRVTRP